eukprot:COSAG02_NODE_31816_length_527_cov_0.532710_2_plen_87_part_01
MSATACVLPFLQLGDILHLTSLGQHKWPRLTLCGVRREELLVVAGVEAGLDAAIAQACASVIDARAESGFYAPASSTLSNEPPTLQP